MEIKLTIDAPGLADAMMALAQAIQGNTELLLQTYSRPDVLGQNVTPIRPVPEPEPTPPAPQAEQPEAPSPDPEPAAEPTAQVITLEAVRAIAAEKSRSGKQDALKALLAEFNASKLTEIPEEKYPDFLKAVEGL